MTDPSGKTKVSVFISPAQARWLRIMVAEQGLAGVSELVGRWIDEAGRSRSQAPCPAERRNAEGM
jgi:hypothetical protein